MEGFKSYRDLLVWQRAMNLAELVYKETSQFPKEEVYGLTSQMRRSAVSIPSNIAEGHARNSPAQFDQFLGISRGSLAELETQILLSEKLGFLKSEAKTLLLKQCDEVSRMLAGLKKSLSN